MQGETAGEVDIVRHSDGSRTLPVHQIRLIAANEERIQDPQRKYSAVSSRKSSSKYHISSTPINKSRDKPEVAVAKNSTRDSDSDSQPEVSEHSSEEASMGDDDISDESHQARSGHPRRIIHSQHRRRRTSYGRRSANKGSWMKPEKFNGHGSFETFLVQFENCCRYNN